MINLIPPKGKRTLKIEYILRVGSTLLFALGFTTLFLTIAQVPSYVLVGAQITELETPRGQEGDNDENMNQLDSEVRLSKIVVSQLQKTTDTYPLTKIIADARAEAPLGITFKSFTINSVAGQPDKVMVQGVATTRDILAAFKNALEAHNSFDTADIPIADLVRDTNLPFLITITLSKGITS